MFDYDLLRVAAAAPDLRVADPAYNAAQTIRAIQHADAFAVDILVCPEMGITGYTCADLFHTRPLQNAALEALEQVRQATFERSMVVLVGLPIVESGLVYNAAAVLHRGQILGIVPKTYLPNYKEFYDVRYFAASAHANTSEIDLLGESVPFGTDLLFADKGFTDLVLGVEICEDLWGPVPPSSLQALHGATVIANLSASNEIIGKAAYRRELVRGVSARCLCAYVYAGAGKGESTTDVVFGGHAMVAENGVLLAESERFEADPDLLIADVDLGRIRHDRSQLTSFHDGPLHAELRRAYRRVVFQLDTRPAPQTLRRLVPAHPFVPQGDALRERCEEIFHIQVCGLAKRLEHIGKPPMSIGISGGLDSTLALLVACRTMDRLGVDRQRIQALTMPGFGTSGRTLANAKALMRLLGVHSREIDIRALCLTQMQQLGHRPFGIDLTGLDVEAFVQRLNQMPRDTPQSDLTFENIQARMRTSLLMNTGFVIGTGDLSELALGWCTYNADHISMYNPNVSIPKTLVKFLVDWAADNQFHGEVRDTLRDIVATEISPELLPLRADGQSTQSTESMIGPYELHDFFLYHFLRQGMGPAKIAYLASQAEFHQQYTPEQIRHWLRVFCRRFFANQFKRSCLPDGPKVGSVSLSPRGDWRMPSDAVATAWLEELH